jgi:hypothetical protein
VFSDHVALSNQGSVVEVCYRGFNRKQGKYQGYNKEVGEECTWSQRSEEEKKSRR